MLELMRKHARNWLMKLLLGIIIIVFIFYFGSLRERDKADTIASIDGKAISYADFQREYENLIDIYRNRFGQNLNEDVLKGLKLKELAVDNLIKQAIILEKAKELDIKASDEEIRNAILSYPAFQNNGAFDKRIYEQTLRLNKMTPENFEIVQRKNLIMTKIQDLITSGVNVADREVFDLYRFQNEKVNLKFLKLSFKDYRGEVRPKRQALENYLKEHGSELRIPEQVQVKYIFFPASDFVSLVMVAEADIKEYYDRNKERLAKPGGKPPRLKEVHEQIAALLKQIAGMQLAAANAKKAHDAIYQQENFDAFASGKGLKVNISPLFSINGTPTEFSALGDFSKKVFPLQKNDLSPVLSDDRGYYIFQITARKPSHIPDFKEAEKEIENRYITDEAKALCRKDAENLLKDLKNGADLEKIAKGKKLKVEETGLFLPGSSIPALGDSQQLAEALAQLSDAKPYPDNVLKVSDAFVIIRFKERGKLDQGDFQAHKGELKNAFMDLKKREVINSWIDGLKNSMMKEGRLKITKDINDASKL